MNKAIIVTGTPATGKTTIAKDMAKKNKAKYIDVNLVIKKYALSEGYDTERDCEIIDTIKLNRVLKSIIKIQTKSL